MITRQPKTYAPYLYTLVFLLCLVLSFLLYRSSHQPSSLIDQKQEVQRARSTSSFAMFPPLEYLSGARTSLTDFAIAKDLVKYVVITNDGKRFSVIQYLDTISSLEGDIARMKERGWEIQSVEVPGATTYMGYFSKRGDALLLMLKDGVYVHIRTSDSVTHSELVNIAREMK